MPNVDKKKMDYCLDLDKRRVNPNTEKLYQKFYFWYQIYFFGAGIRSKIFGTAFK
jgi:hypothetical protein